MGSSHDLSAVSAPEPTVRGRVAWVGGIVHLRGFRHAGRPMRIAAWMTSSGTLLDAAIVDRNGPTLLRTMLDELTFIAPSGERPTELLVWPAVKSAFKELEFPRVEVLKDEFLRIVVDDHADAGHLPHGLPVRAG